MVDLHQAYIRLGQGGGIRACGLQEIAVRVGQLMVVEDGGSHPLGGSRPEVPMVKSRGNGGGIGAVKNQGKPQFGVAAGMSRWGI